MTYCQYCFGTGTVLALATGTLGTPYAFVCACSRARHRSFPNWNPALKKEFEVLEQQTPDQNNNFRRPPSAELKRMPK